MKAQAKGREKRQVVKRLGGESGRAHSPIGCRGERRERAQGALRS